MASRVSIVFLACVLSAGLAGCGSSGGERAPRSAGASPTLSMRECLRRQGYSISPESAAVRATAPRSFEFVAVWNLLDPDRVALTLTISKSPAGASRAAAWTRRTNQRMGKGVVHAPVTRFGRVDVLWTAEPGRSDANAVYGCVRSRF